MERGRPVGRLAGWLAGWLATARSLSFFFGGGKFLRLRAAARV